jgi:hypothetical protein
MMNQIRIPHEHIATWLDRWCSNSLSEEIRREIDAEILSKLCDIQPGKDIPQVPVTPDWQLWLTDEQRNWCVNLGIQFTADLKSDPQGIAFTFEYAEHATQFAITWL